MRYSWSFVAVLLSFPVSMSSCSQMNSPGDLGGGTFAGSTPANSLIKSILNIPTGDSCEFIKWELHLNKSKKDTNTFSLTALYGESQPNTNGFKGGGKKITIAGKYTARDGVGENPGLKLYCLSGEKLSSFLFLIEMDDNVLHFADSNNKLLVGNGGWGYVLNRTDK